MLNCALLSLPVLKLPRHFSARSIKLQCRVYSHDRNHEEGNLVKKSLNAISYEIFLRSASRKSPGLCAASDICK